MNLSFLLQPWSLFFSAKKSVSSISIEYLTKTEATFDMHIKTYCIKRCQSDAGLIFLKGYKLSHNFFEVWWGKTCHLIFDINDIPQHKEIWTTPSTHGSFSVHSKDVRHPHFRCYSKEEDANFNCSWWKRLDLNWKS